MTMRWTALALVAAAASSTIAPARSSAAVAALLVPAYFDPNADPADWSRLDAAAARVPVTAIFNPDSGPGVAADPAYASALAALRAAGGAAAAYVHTQTGDGSLRPLADVEHEVDVYRSFYSFDGVFVDEMTDDTSPSHLSFYASLYSYVKAKSPAYRVIGNPGTNVPSAYAGVADVLVTYEDTASNFGANAPKSWTQSRQASGFATVVYKADASSLAATLRQAAAQNAGYVYVTDNGADGNPYDSLPSYFAAEVNAIPEPSALAAIGALTGIARRRRAKETA